MSEKLLEVKNLCKNFKTDSQAIWKLRRIVHAVSNVSVSIQKGETVGVVGESGCGKSTLGRCILRLIEPTNGEVLYHGKNILQYSAEEMRHLRTKMQIVFQNPYSSLNPRMTIREAILSPLDVFHIGTKEERKKRANEMIEYVGLNQSHLSRYPHEFSGGQLQRVVIARALILNPEFVVCDEPVSALDVSIRSQVINLMVDLQKQMGLTYLFISHDLSVVRYLCNRVMVMYLGQIVESSETNALFEHPLHPYTMALVEAIPIPVVSENPHEKRKRRKLQGEIPSPIDLPKGCLFHTRCPMCMDVCRVQEPPVCEMEDGRMVKCYLYAKKDDE